MRFFDTVVNDNVGPDGQRKSEVFSMSESKLDISIDTLPDAGQIERVSLWYDHSNNPADIDLQRINEQQSRIVRALNQLVPDWNRNSPGPGPGFGRYVIGFRNAVVRIVRY